MRNGKWTDFVSDFMELTQDTVSPDLFRKWSAISLIAGALERRVWARVGPYQTFPNLYVLLVAPPGVGKYTIELVRALWTETREPGGRGPAFKVGPDNMTKASLMDTLAKSKQVKLTPDGPPLVYHSLLVASEEFSVLLPAYDLEYIGSLNSIYNNKPLHEESRRTGSVRELKIEFPQLNILGGTQPGWLASIFPEEAWSTGLTSRMIMVYSPETPLKDVFADSEWDLELYAQMLSRLSHMAELQGSMSWTPGAFDRMRQWHLAGGPPAPQHSKLENYNRRRTSMHVVKLAIVSAISRTGDFAIDLVDANRAIEWLLEAETLMPDIFRAMIGRSDSQVIEELYNYVVSTWAKGGPAGRPVHERHMVDFLRQRVPSDKVEKILLVAERAGVFERIAGTETFRPRARLEMGVE